MLQLHFAPDTCSLAALIALEEAGAAYESVHVDFGRKQQQSPEYLALNAKGRVPTLVTEQGNLTEIPAILIYICQRFPDAGLAPLDDAFALARAQSFNSYICSTLHVAHAHRMRGYRWADDPDAIAAMQRKVPQSVGACYALIENDLAAGSWVMGEAYTVCDAYLFTLAQWLEADGVDPRRFPGVIEHRRRVSERPAVKRALARERA